MTSLQLKGIALLFVTVVLLSSTPFVYADVSTTSTSATVENAKPLFLRYWIDGQGPVEYVSDGTFTTQSNGNEYQNGAFYYMKDGGITYPFNSEWIADNSKYVIDIEPPIDESRTVDIRVEIFDANGFDDLADSQVEALFNPFTGGSGFPPINLVRDDNTVSNGGTVVEYKGSFELYRETAAGSWQIQFAFSDVAKSDLYYYTNMGGFYDSETIAISIWDGEGSAEANNFGFGTIIPGASGSTTMLVQNDGNVDLSVTVDPIQMSADNSGNTLDPAVSETYNSNEISAGVGAFTIAQPLATGWSSFMKYMGKAIFGLSVPEGTASDTYGGTIVVSPVATAIP